MQAEKPSKTKFDLKLFAKIFEYTKPYRGVFLLSAFSALLVSGFAVLTPSLVGQLIDQAITNRNAELLLSLVITMSLVLLGEVVFQLLFTYTANLLGESVIQDVRVKLVSKMIRFRMAYYDKSSIGVLVTRAVSDMQKIGEIFSQGFFMIVADVLKMAVVASVMVVLNYRLAFLVFAISALSFFFLTIWVLKIGYKNLNILK